MPKCIKGAAYALASGLLFAAIPASAAALSTPDEPQIAGDWEGTLVAGGVELTVVFHISEGEDGTLSATLDSPDQGAFGIPCDAVSVEGREIDISVEMVQGSYSGTLSEDGTTIEGTWTQPAAELPLVLTRVAEPAAEPEGDSGEG